MKLPVLRYLTAFLAIIFSAFPALAQSSDPYKQDKYWYLSGWVMLFVAGCLLLIVIFLVRKIGEKPKEENK